MAENKFDQEKVLGFIENPNIARDIDEDTLIKLGDTCFKGFEADLDSRSEWEERVEEWVKLATQVVETKSYPWQGASNVKFPLVTIAAMQFAARAYPSLVPANGNLVNVKVVGFDPTGEKSQTARRVSKFMSYQVMDEMPNWEEEMDKALLNLPIVGTCFKKTYYSSFHGKSTSELVLAKDLVVNYWAKDLSRVRKTEIKYLDSNDIEERVRADQYLDVDLGKPSFSDLGLLHKDRTDGIGSAPQDEGDHTTTPYTILEQHCWYDLDGDGYAEPYIVDFDYKTKKVLRIIARYDSEGVFLSEDQSKVVRIEPIEYYTKFGFIPNPDGGFYDLGFGLLLGPINHSVNTLINQLIDAGSLSNLQAGFIARGLTLKGGMHQFRPGEWKVVNPVGDDLRKGVIPLPVREPSNVLFQLLGMLVQSGKELASVAEIFVGKMPGQNTPATTTQMTVEEGMRLFTAIYKRLYRGLTQEFRKIFDLNSRYLPEGYSSFILGDQTLGQAQPNDFDKQNKFKVLPAADPTTASQSQKLAKSQALLQLIPSGMINPQEAIRRVLEAQEQEGIEQLMQVPQQGPSPEQQEAQAKQQEMQMKMQIEQEKAQLKAKEAEMKMMLEQQKAAMAQQTAETRLSMEKAMKQLDIQMEQVKASMALKHANDKHQFEMAKTLQQVQLERVSAQEKLRQQDETHKQTLAQKEAELKAKPKTTKIKKTSDGYDVSEG